MKKRFSPFRKYFNVKKPRIIDVDFPGVAQKLGVTEGYIGKIHYLKKSKKDRFLSLFNETNFVLYKVREETRQPWLAIHFKDNDEVNFFRLMFGTEMLHQCYVIRKENTPNGTVISVNKYTARIEKD